MKCKRCSKKSRGKKAGAQYTVAGHGGRGDPCGMCAHLAGVVSVVLHGDDCDVGSSSLFLFAAPYRFNP
jgi:hypothetical protein